MMASLDNQVNLLFKIDKLEDHIIKSISKITKQEMIAIGDIIKDLRKSAVEIISTNENLKGQRATLNFI